MKVSSVSASAIAATSLDDPSISQPVAEVFVATKVPWV